MTGQKGICLWLTGRSGAGKSTLTKALLPLLEREGRAVTVLDVVPYLAKHWFERSSEGKLLRKAFVASHQYIENKRAAIARYEAQCRGLPEGPQRIELRQRIATELALIPEQSRPRNGGC